MRNPLDGSKVGYILDELCTKLGFCLPPTRREWLQSKPPKDLDAFSDAVLVAEGLNPQAERRLRKSVRELIAKHWEDGDDEDVV